MRDPDKQIILEYPENLHFSSYKKNKKTKATVSTPGYPLVFQSSGYSRKTKIKRKIKKTKATVSTPGYPLVFQSCQVFPQNKNKKKNQENERRDKPPGYIPLYSRKTKTNMKIKPRPIVGQSASTVGPQTLRPSKL